MRGGVIYAGQYRLNASDQRLQTRKMISDVWPDHHLHVFIGLPAGMGKLAAEDTGGECFILGISD